MSFYYQFKDHMFSSVGKDNALYMQGPGFESRPPQKKKKKTLEILLVHIKFSNVL